MPYGLGKGVATMTADHAGVNAYLSSNHFLTESKRKPTWITPGRLF